MYIRIFFILVSHWCRVFKGHCCVCACDCVCVCVCVCEAYMTFGCVDKTLVPAVCVCVCVCTCGLK